MTANQINYLLATEGIRHDMVTEDETKRHNIALEGIETRRNEIQEAYNATSLDLKKELETARLEWEKAEGSKKLELEEQMNWIRQQQADADAQYKYDMARVQESLADITAEWNANQVKLREIDQDIQSKYNEYQKHQWDEANEIARTKNMLEANRIEEDVRYHDLWKEVNDTSNRIRELDVNQQFTLEMLKLSQNREYLTLAQEKQPYELNYLSQQEKYLKSQTILNKVNTFDYFNPFSKGSAKDALNFSSQLLHFGF